MSEPSAPFEDLLESLKHAGAALREAGVPFALGGGLAIWARGGPETEHDVDLFIRPEDADRALEVLGADGFRTEKPPEGWLVKAWRGDVLVAKLMTLREHQVDYDLVLEIARTVRVQIDCDEVRERTSESPYAKAFFTLVEELGVSA